ncbi:IS66 family transposase [Oligella ureolytica]
MSTLSAEQLRKLVLQSQVIISKDAVITAQEVALVERQQTIAQTEAVVIEKEQTNKRLELKISQLTMELATLRRISFAKRSDSSLIYRHASLRRMR